MITLLCYLCQQEAGEEDATSVGKKGTFPGTVLVEEVGDDLAEVSTRMTATTIDGNHKRLHYNHNLKPTIICCNM